MDERFLLSLFYFPSLSSLPSLSHLAPTVGKRRYSIKLWKTFTDCFNCLPIAAVIDDKIFCCHGGKPSTELRGFSLCERSLLYSVEY